MMTPCSKKLQDHKKKAFTKYVWTTVEGESERDANECLHRVKPTSLASRFGKAMAESKERQAASSSSGGLFGEPASQ